jgi:hypothetical protein
MRSQGRRADPGGLGLGEVLFHRVDRGVTFSAATPADELGFAVELEQGRALGQREPGCAAAGAAVVDELGFGGKVGAAVRADRRLRRAASACAQPLNIVDVLWLALPWTR